MGNIFSECKYCRSTNPTETPVSSLPEYKTVFLDNKTCIFFQTEDNNKLEYTEI